MLKFFAFSAALISLAAWGLLGSLAVTHEGTPLLILNMENEEEQLPRTFRSCGDASLQARGPLSKGLAELRVSGSSQFSEKGLKAILRYLHYPSNFIVVDLRQENHGFINGMAVNWYAPRNWENVGRSLSQVEALEAKYLNGIQNEKNVVIYRVLEKGKQSDIVKIDPLQLPVHCVLSERELAKAFNLTYVRLPITDHVGPPDLQVDAFVSLVRSLPKDAWMHVHCKGGKGRSTTFMAMYDMMHNAKQVSFEDIVLRQNLLGGNDLFKLPAENHWKLPYALERQDFLRSFYKYCRQNTDNFATSWSAYQSNNK